MNDRELLELAAKAAGIAGYWHPAHGLVVGYVRKDDGDLSAAHWNPLTDDGDALRLAIVLRLKFERHRQPFVAAFSSEVPGKFEENEGNDIYAATRRAIVRAAAEIGKAMP